MPRNIDIQALSKYRNVLRRLNHSHLYKRHLTLDEPVINVRNKHHAERARANREKHT
jgi:hypothetical protein